MVVVGVVCGRGVGDLLLGGLGGFGWFGFGGGFLFAAGLLMLYWLLLSGYMLLSLPSPKRFRQPFPIKLDREPQPLLDRLPQPLAHKLGHAFLQVLVRKHLHLIQPLIGQDIGQRQLNGAVGRGVPDYILGQE